MTDQPLYLSRLRLRREPGATGSLAALLTKMDDAGSAHRLVWSLFATDGDERRDFLFRQTGRGEFYALSARSPADSHRLWRVDTKPFEPALAPGDRLGFSLRANPVVRRRPDGPKGKQRRHDVVMDRLAALPKVERAGARDAAERGAGYDWLAARAERHGFQVAKDEIAVEGYLQHRIDRARGARPVRFSSLDFEGVLTVTEPAQFTALLPRGLGGAKAYGCGLMLIRRL